MDPKKLIIEVAVNENLMREGGQLMSADSNESPRLANPHLPYTSEEIAQSALECYNAGASIIHFHARQPDTGAPMMDDPPLVIAGMRAIQKVCPIICYPTAARQDPEGCYLHYREGFKEPDIRWEMGQCDLSIMQSRSLQFRVNFCVSHGIKPGFSLFDAGDLRAIRNLIADGDLPADEPISIKFFFGTQEIGLGSRGGVADTFQLRPNARTLEFLLAEGADLPLSWMTAVWWDTAIPMATEAIARGGHVRVGIGDYGYPEFGSPNSAALVERIVEIARAFGREPATPDEAREMLGIKAKKPALAGVGGSQ